MKTEIRPKRLCPETQLAEGQRARGILYDSAPYLRTSRNRMACVSSRRGEANISYQRSSHQGRRNSILIALLGDHDVRPWLSHSDHVAGWTAIERFA